MFLASDGGSLTAITTLISSVVVAGIGAWALVTSAGRRTTNEDTAAKVTEASGSMTVLERVYDDLATERGRREQAEKRVTVLEREILDMKAAALAADRGHPDRA